MGIIQLVKGETQGTAVRTKIPNIHVNYTPPKKDVIPISLFKDTIASF